MGAGAGYDITVRGIELDNQNWKILSDDYDERYDSHTVQVEIPVKPCVAEYWAAEAYYEGIDSNHDLYDGNWDNQIDGGTATLQLEVYPPQWIKGDIMTSEELNEAVGELLPSTLNLTMMYGGGWSHVYLSEEGIVFDDDNGRVYLDEGETYDYITVRCELKCPNIAQNINEFFKNPDAYYDEDGISQYPEEDDDEIVNSRKPIKSDVDYENSYAKEFDDMVEENGYDVNEKFTYMAGIQPEDWRDEYTGAANAYSVDVAGYYKLGDAEGMVLVGKLQDIYDYCDQVWGMGLHPDYVCPADSFDYEDGEWVTGGWIDSSVKKPIKSSGSEEWFGLEMIYDQLSEYFHDYGFNDVRFEGIDDTKARVEFQGWHEYDIDQFYKNITNISHYFSNDVVPIWFTMDVVNGGSCKLVVNVEKPM